MCTDTYNLPQTEKKCFAYFCAMYKNMYFCATIKTHKDFFLTSIETNPHPHSSYYFTTLQCKVHIRKEISNHQLFSAFEIERNYFHHFPAGK